MHDIVDDKQKKKDSRCSFQCLSFFFAFYLALVIYLLSVWWGKHCNKTVHVWKIMREQTENEEKKKWKER